jgi:hypothetical protein
MYGEFEFIRNVSSAVLVSGFPLSVVSRGWICHATAFAAYAGWAASGLLGLRARDVLRC